jgi:hypothetical protein
VDRPLVAIAKVEPLNPAEELQAAMASNPVGTPVAIRMSITSATESPMATAAAVAFAASVFSSEPARIGCQADAETGYIASLVEYSDGQTASINVISMPHNMATIELMLIGNQHTLQLDLDDCSIHSDERHSVLIVAVERACTSGATIELSQPD